MNPRFNLTPDVLPSELQPTASITQSAEPVKEETFTSVFAIPDEVVAANAPRRFEDLTPEEQAALPQLTVDADNDEDLEPEFTQEELDALVEDLDTPSQEELNKDLK